MNAFADYVVSVEKAYQSMFTDPLIASFLNDRLKSMIQDDWMEGWNPENTAVKIHERLTGN